MPAKKTKSHKKATKGKTVATKAKTQKTSKKKVAKLPGFFSFGNRKFVILLVLIVASVGFGSYKLYSARAATDGKTTFPTVAQCYKFKPHLYINVPNQRECTKTVQQFLNVYKLHRSTSWQYLTVDGLYGSRTANAVYGFRTRNNLSAGTDVNGPTWTKIYTTCSNGKYYPSVAAAYRNVCGF